MTFARISTGLLCLALLLTSMPVQAQDRTTDRCVTAVYSALHREQLFYRGVLFGQIEAAKMPRGAIRYDKEMSPWIKTGSSEWKTYVEKFKDTVRTDAEMDTNAYPEQRRGLLETQKSTTSDLLPLMLQSLRAFQCRLRDVCAAAIQSRSSGDDLLKVKVDGCVEYEIASMPACLDSAEAEGSAFEEDQNYLQVGVCDQAAQGILDRETDILTLVVSYDASYRSFLQFAGIMQEFTTSLQEPVLDVLTNMVMNLQKFGSVPCFSSQCND